MPGLTAHTIAVAMLSAFIAPASAECAFYENPQTSEKIEFRGDGTILRTDGLTPVEYRPSACSANQTGTCLGDVRKLSAFWSYKRPDDGRMVVDGTITFFQSCDRTREPWNTMDAEASSSSS